MVGIILDLFGDYGSKRRSIWSYVIPVVVLGVGGALIWKLVQPDIPEPAPILMLGDPRGPKGSNTLPVEPGFFRQGDENVS